MEITLSFIYFKFTQYIHIHNNIIYRLSKPPPQPPNIMPNGNKNKYKYKYNTALGMYGVSNTTSSPSNPNKHGVQTNYFWTCTRCLQMVDPSLSSCHVCGTMRQSGPPDNQQQQPLQSITNNPNQPPVNTPNNYSGHHNHQPPHQQSNSRATYGSSHHQITPNQMTQSPYGYNHHNANINQNYYTKSSPKKPTVHIIPGSVAERCRLDAYFVYTLVLTIWVYPIVVHWMWSSTGWLSPFNDNISVINGGGIDFAGSGVVHMVGGFSGLCGAILLGPRHLRFDTRKKASNSCMHLKHLFTYGHNLGLYYIYLYVEC